MKKIILITILTILLLIAGCTNNKSTGGNIIAKDVNDNNKEIAKIGVLVPLTGPLGYFGEEIKEGIELANNEINSNNPNKKIEFVYQDSKCDAKEVSTALNTLDNIKNVNAIIGPFCGTGIQVAAEYSKQNELIMITPATNFGKISENYFSTQHLIERETKALANYLYDDLQITKLGILYFNNDFGIIYRDYLGKDFEKLGGTITGNVAYDFSTTKMQTEIFELLEKDSEALFFVGGKRENIIEEIRELNKDVNITTQFSIENPQTIDIAGKKAEGIIYAFDEKNIGIIKNIITKKYPEKFDLKSDYYISQSYLTMFILNNALQQCELEDVKCQSNILQNSNNIKELGLELNFNKNTWEYETKLNIKTVENGEFIVVN